MANKQLISPTWLIPVEPRKTLYKDHSLLIVDEKIADILPSKNARTQYSDVPELVLDRHVLMPGFINAHAHSPMTLLRSIGEDHDFDQWLHQHILPAEQALIDADFVADGTQLAIAEMLLSGTTTFSEHYFYPEQTIAMAKTFGMRCCVGLWVGAYQGQWCQGEEASFDKSLATYHQQTPHDLISYAWAPHSPYLTSEPFLNRILEHANTHALPIHIHCQETTAEVQRSLEAYGCTPWQRLKRIGYDQPQTVLAHMVATSDQDIESIEHAHIISCPISNLKLGSGIAPIAKFLEAGINLALGTDGAASNNSLDMLLEMKLLALGQKGVGQDAALMPCWQALECATINGARALGLADKIGSLTPGKQADMIAIDLDHPRTYPHHDPLSQCIHAATSDQIKYAWIAGKARLEQGVLTHTKLRAYQSIAQRWSEKTRPYAHSSFKVI